MSKQLEPIHRGEILRGGFMKPFQLSIHQLGRDSDVPPNRISAIVNGTGAITADSALRNSLPRAGVHRPNPASAEK